ncbi:MAG: hypothetical protein M0D57_20320 [Sphingobacteriales bacterium JAD_PAG50586_3]|nr:MAG: hypothetical protein M0D57_20320 [Sphingobacteriales bacterium JAD_PAG50586_3]
MQRIAIFFILSFSLIIFAGCPYGSTFSAGDTKKAVAIKKITGTWESKAPGITTMVIADLKKNYKGYQLGFEPGSTYDPQGMMQIDTAYAVHINTIEGHLIASVREPAPEGKFFFYKVELKGDSLYTHEVDEKAFDKEVYKTEADFRTALATKLKNKAVFIEKKVWWRKKK